MSHTLVTLEGWISYRFSLNLVQFFYVLLGENNPQISEEEIEKLYVQANHFALVRLILFLSGSKTTTMMIVIFLYKKSIFKQ